MKYTFFLDIDGTLLWNSSRPTDELLRVVSKAQRLGHRFFINTARAYGNIDPKIFPLSAFDGLASGCGTRIIYEGRCIYEHTIPPEAVFNTVDTVLNAQPDIKLVIEAVDKLYVNGKHHWDPTKTVLYTSAAELREKYPNIMAQKFATKSNSLITKNTAALLHGDFDVYFHKAYTEIVPKGYSKGKAAEIVEKTLSIPHESTVAIGDSYNDIPMFEYCAHSIAMGNAPDDVKAVCSSVTETAENDGAARAIARMCGISYS